MCHFLLVIRDQRKFAYFLGNDYALLSDLQSLLRPLLPVTLSFYIFLSWHAFMLSLIAAANNTLVATTASSLTTATTGTIRTQAIISPCITTPVVAKIAVAAANLSAAVAIMSHPSM